MHDSVSRIDTHCHFVPPIWREECVRHGHGKPDGMPGIPVRPKRIMHKRSAIVKADNEAKPWSEEAHLEMMKRANISKSILSITSPGTHLIPGNDTLARRLTRQCNEFAAELKKRRPEQFGFWASLPLPDVEGSLQELEYAFDTLNADGVVVMTNAHGVYLGDERLDPVFEALEKRKAKVFIHPSQPCCSGTTTDQPSSAVPLTQYPSPMFEYFFDTARAAINLLVSGTVRKHPSVTYLLSHAGGAIPPLVDRIAKVAMVILKCPEEEMGPEAVKKLLRTRFYFDLAGFVFPEQIQGLLPYVDASRLTYGSDYPFTPEPHVLNGVKVMEQHLPLIFTRSEDHSAVNMQNALELLQK